MFPLIGSIYFASIMALAFCPFGRHKDFTILPPPISRRVKSLVEISLHCLAEHFDAVEDLGESANADHRAKLGHLLSR